MEHTSPSIALTRRFRSYGCCAMRVVSLTLNQAAQTDQWEDRHNINTILGDIGSHETAMETPNTKMCTLIFFFPQVWTMPSYSLAQVHHTVFSYDTKNLEIPQMVFLVTKMFRKVIKCGGFWTSKLQQLQYVSSSSKKALENHFLKSVSVVTVKRCLTHNSGLSRAVTFSCIIGSSLQALLWEIRTHSNMASMLSSYLFSLVMTKSNIRLIRYFT